MSESHVFKVPDDLHSIVERAYMDFAAKNPVLSMGSDERRAQLKGHLSDATISAAVASAAPPPEWATELGFDPNDDHILRTLSKYKPAREFLVLVRGWPRSFEERSAFARRIKYSAFVAQYMRQGMGAAGTHNASYSEGTDGWEPATAKTIARKAFL